MPQLTRGAAELIERLRALLTELEKERVYARDEARKLTSLELTREKTRDLGYNIQDALGTIDRLAHEIVRLIDGELRSMLERKSWRDSRAQADLEKRLAALEAEVEALRRPKNVTDMNEAKRKEGNSTK
jgi:ABC-type phosphate transport system auxiliary subunit